MKIFYMMLAYCVCNKPIVQFDDVTRLGALPFPPTSPRRSGTSAAHCSSDEQCAAAVWPSGAFMRASCSAPNQVTLLRISGVHHEHVPADLGQRVLMASACLRVTYIELSDPAGASLHLHRRRTSNHHGHPA